MALRREAGKEEKVGVAWLDLLTSTYLLLIVRSRTEEITRRVQRRKEK